MYINYNQKMKSILKFAKKGQHGAVAPAPCKIPSVLFSSPVTTNRSFIDLLESGSVFREYFGIIFL